MRRLLLVAAVAALSVAPMARAWTWPADGAVLQQFDFDPAHPYAGGQHRGIDIAGSLGATVPAPASGSVTYAGTVPGSGKSVTITTPDGYAVTLTHLGSIAVAKGAAVAEGDGVGTIGPSDGAYPGPYVHLGIRLASNDQGYVDPLTFLPARRCAPPRRRPRRSRRRTRAAAPILSGARRPRTRRPTRRRPTIRWQPQRRLPSIPPRLRPW